MVIEVCLILLIICLFITVFMIFICPVYGENWEELYRRMDDFYVVNVGVSKDNKENVSNPLDLM